MALTVDWDARIVDSSASITDIVAFKDELRLLEQTDEGMLHPGILTYKKVDIGGGAFFHAVDFINSYRLRFPVAGNYEIVGNVGAQVIPVAGVFVTSVKASAFATGPGSITPELEASIYEIHRILGLDRLAPVNHLQTGVSAGNIQLTYTGDGETSTTTQRV